jgi:hypothetical protein
MITLNWRFHKILDVSYYYTFHNGKFWCVKSDYVVNSVVTDSDYVFQVTVSKMDEKTKNGLVQRLADLFSELELQVIKNALCYDKHMMF